MLPASFPAVMPRAMPRAMPEAAIDGVRWLTYDEMAETLGIGRERARVLTKRKRWPRRAGNDGKARIGVPDDEIMARSDPGSAPEGHPPCDPGIDPPSEPGGEPDQLTELRVLNARLEAQIEALKAIAAVEKAQAERERQLVEKATEEARAERDRWAAQAKQLVTTVDP